MAEPCDFQGANVVLRAPEGWTQEQCVDMPILKTEDGQLISAWRLTPEEMIKIQNTGVIWLKVLTTAAPPPVCVLIDSPITIHDPKTGEALGAPAVMPIIKRAPRKED